MFPARPLRPVLTACLLGLLAGLGPGRAAGTTAGTVIHNQGTARVGTGVYLSNPVETTVRAVCAVSVRPDGTPGEPAFRVGVAPGGDAALPYRVTNAGNAPQTLTLSWRIDARSDFMPAPAEVRLHRDMDGDGLLDPGEPAADHLTLPADAAADVLLVVRAPLSAAGSAFLSLVAACPGGGASDGDNVAQLRTGPFADLQLEKRFSPEFVAPGGGSTVTLRLRNTGVRPSAPVLTEDLLDTPELRGLAYVPGSARADLGAVVYLGPSGAVTGSEPPRPAGLRWQVPGLEPGQTALLRFGLRAEAGAAPGPRTNVATALGADLDTPLRAEAGLTVRPTPGLALGPAGNPEAAPGGEGSADDQQVQPGAVLGQPACFRQTVRNTGNVADAVTLSGQVEAGSGTLVLRAPDGLPLVQPLPLPAGAGADFLACLTVGGEAPGGGAGFRLTAHSAAGAAPNATADRLGRLDARSPGLTKTVTPEGTVAVGTWLTYTLRAENPYPFPLTDLVLEDRLDEHLVFRDASDGGRHDRDTRRVTWTLPVLAPGGSVTVHLTAEVGPTPDDTPVANRFSLAARELPNPRLSPPVVTPVFSSGVLVSKSVAEASVGPGDRATYTLRVRNGSAAVPVEEVRLTDTPPAGLVYVPGTSTLGGQPFADPEARNGSLLWTLPDLAPGQEVTLAYQLRVTPQARAPLVNVALVAVRGARGSAVQSAVARAAVRLDPGVFALTFDLVGTVYVDADGDGRYHAGLDTPVRGARVLLAGGRSALTDTQGRYHFARVPGGVHALRLDPAGLHTPPRPVPQDGGRPGTRTLSVWGLTSVDFPLVAPTGGVSSLRETTLRRGDVTLHKVVTPTRPGQYEVTLTLDAPRALPGLHLLDPLPPGATLLGGDHDLRPAFSGGQATFTYRFALAGPPEAAVTDPTLDWRLP